MPRTFNTTGPCNPADHYMIAPERRSRDLLPFVQEKLYFVMHAARQTGKTTAMRAFAERLRGLGYAAVWATLEESQGFTEVEDAEPLWLQTIARGAGYSLPAAQRPPPIETALGGAPGARLHGWLSAWAAALGEVPLVLLLDEADTSTAARSST